MTNRVDTPDARPDKTRMLTIPEVAARLQITRAYAYELARQGVLPAIRIGPKYVRVSEATLAAWIEQQQTAQPVVTESRLPMPPLRFAVFQGPEKALIHSTTCGYCRRPGASGTWHRGPGKRGFGSLEEARAAAKLLPVSAIEHTCITGARSSGSEPIASQLRRAGAHRGGGGSLGSGLRRPMFVGW